MDNDYYHVTKNMHFDLIKKQPHTNSYYDVVIRRAESKNQYQVRKKYHDEITLARQWIDNSEVEDIIEDLRLMECEKKFTRHSDLLSKDDFWFSYSPYQKAIYLYYQTYGRRYEMNTTLITKKAIPLLCRYYYEKEGIYKDVLIRWSEAHIPRSKNLSIRFDINKPKKGE